MKVLFKGNESMTKNTSTHILSTSSNLLGFCFLVLTSIKITKLNATSLLDEFTGVASILLMISSVLSFLSIRSGNTHKGENYEKYAELIFLAALTIIFILIILVSFLVAF